MDKEKEIEELVKVLRDCEEYADIYGNSIEHTATAKNLLNAGYGNIKQAVREFAEKFEEKICQYSTYDGWSVLKIFARRKQT